jgi:hypothetical protein
MPGGGPRQRDAAGFWGRGGRPRGGANIPRGRQRRRRSEVARRARSDLGGRAQPRIEEHSELPTIPLPSGGSAIEPAGGEVRLVLHEAEEEERGIEAAPAMQPHG